MHFPETTLCASGFRSFGGSERARMNTREWVLSIYNTNIIRPFISQLPNGHKESTAIGALVIAIFDESEPRVFIALHVIVRLNGKQKIGEID